MGRSPRQIVNDFIENIPEDKFKDIHDGEDTLWKDIDLRLDMQGVTTSEPKNAISKCKSTTKRQTHRSLAGKGKRLQVHWCQ